MHRYLLPFFYRHGGERPRRVAFAQDGECGAPGYVVGSRQGERRGGIAVGCVAPLEAADRFDRSGHKGVGACHEEGSGVPGDPPAGRRWGVEERGVRTPGAVGDVGVGKLGGGVHEDGLVAFGAVVDELDPSPSRPRSPGRDRSRVPGTPGSPWPSPGRSPGRADGSPSGTGLRSRRTRPPRARRAPAAGRAA